MKSNSEYNSILEYLMSVTNYSKKSLLSKKEDILYNMHLRIKMCMEQYPFLILDLQEKLGINRYSLDDLKKMNYHELCSIKNKLKKGHIIDDIVNEDVGEYQEPILISPDDLYISYGIDYHYYTDKQLLDMGFVVIDKEQNNYLVSVRQSLYEKLINFFKTSEIYVKYDSMSLEQLIDIYMKCFKVKIEYQMISDMEDEIRLEKGYKNE